MESDIDCPRQQTEVPLSGVAQGVPSQKYRIVSHSYVYVVSITLIQKTRKCHWNGLWMQRSGQEV